MASDYYEKCSQLTECERLIQEFFLKEKYQECFIGHLRLAEEEYPLAECQVGYFYFEGLGTEKDLAKAFYWTNRAAAHGDRDGQFNLGYFYENGIGTDINRTLAKEWYHKAALQNHDLAKQKIKVFYYEN